MEIENGFFAVQEWLYAELGYAERKRGEVGREEDVYELEGTMDLMETAFVRDMLSYLKRAAVLGIDNPNGRQAMGKAIGVGVRMLIAVHDQCGDIGPAGVHSGAGE